MKVVLLVGGKGIRLAGEDAPLPKALFRIGNQPIVYHIMRGFAEAGFRSFLLTLGYRGEQIVDYFLHKWPYLHSDLRLRIDSDNATPRVDRLGDADEDWDVLLAQTGLDAPTGERIRRVREYLASDDLFIVTYGDGLSDLDPRDLVTFHREHGRAGTVTVIRAHSQFGHVAFDDDHTVSRLDEKPLLPGWVNGGFFVFDQRLFDYLEPGDSLETNCLPRMIEDGQLMARPWEGFWACMDTYKDGLQLNELWASGQPPWR